jgi:hypothetical protein
MSIGRLEEKERLGHRTVAHILADLRHLAAIETHYAASLLKIGGWSGNSNSSHCHNGTPNEEPTHVAVP